MIWIVILFFVGQSILTVYTLASMAVRVKVGGESAKRIWFYTKWPALVAVVALGIAAKLLTDDDAVPEHLPLMLGLFSWWLGHDAGDDEDEWKKLKKKAREKVRVVAGRLAVVPA